MVAKARQASRHSANGVMPLRGLAPALGLGVRTLERLVAEGVIAPTRAGSGRIPAFYDPLDTARRILAHRVQESPRNRRERSQAELNEMRLARERRTLLPRATVVTEGQAFVNAVVAKLRALPSRLVRAGVLTRDAEPAVAELLRDAQAEMARWQSHLDLLKALDKGAGS